MTFRVCQILALALAIVLGILMEVWHHFGNLPEYDEVLARSQSIECSPSNYDSVDFLKRSGFMRLKGFVPEQDRNSMIDFVSRVPLPTRYLCGASDTQPRECMLWSEVMTEMFPTTINRLQDVLQEWRESGIVQELSLDKWGPLEARGSEFITINGWGWPWNKLKGRWEYLMGTTMFGVPRAISQFKSFLTMAFHAPVHTGFHDWHTDGPSQDGGRYHKLFIMVDKDSRNGTLRNHTNLMLIPRISFYKHFRRMERNSFTMGYARMLLYKYLGRIHFYHGLNQLACTPILDPGDALFFREDVWHRTQDMKANRFSLIIDIQ